MPSVTKIGNDKQGMFSLHEGDKTIGSLTYTINETSQMVIDHTEVEEGHEGKGYGKLLIDAAAQFARDHKYKVKPACSYANKVMKRSDEYSDLLG